MKEVLITSSILILAVMVLRLVFRGKVSQKLMTGRYHGEEAKKDIHEKDVAYLTRSRTAALYCTDRLGWQHVRCDDGAEPLPIPQIHETILKGRNTDFAGTLVDLANEHGGGDNITVVAVEG